MDCQRGRLLQESESAGVLPAVAEAVPSQQQLLYRFYRSVVESTVLFNQVCWYNTAKNGNSDRLSHTAATASITTGQQVRSQESASRESRESSRSGITPPVSPAGQESASRESIRSGVRLPRVQQVRSPPPASPAGQKSTSRESSRSGVRLPRVLQVRNPEAGYSESRNSGVRSLLLVSPEIQESGVCFP